MDGRNEDRLTLVAPGRNALTCISTRADLMSSVDHVNASEADNIKQNLYFMAKTNEIGNQQIGVGWYQ